MQPSDAAHRGAGVSNRLAVGWRVLAGLWNQGLAYAWQGLAGNGSLPGTVFDECSQIAGSELARANDKPSLPLGRSSLQHLLEERDRRFEAFQPNGAATDASIMHFALDHRPARPRTGVMDQPFLARAPGRPANAGDRDCDIGL